MNYLKHIQNFLFKRKKYILAAFVVYLLALFFLFPYEEILQKELVKAQGQLKGFQFEYQSISVGVFPPRLSLKEVEFAHSSLLNNISLDQVVIKPSYLSLLAFKLGAKINLLKEKSSVYLKIQNNSSKDQTEFSIRAYSPYTHIQHLDFLSSFFLNAKGSVNFLLNLKVDPNFNLSPEGELKIYAQNLEFKPYLFSKQYLGTITIPSLKWAELKGEFELSDNKIRIENFKVGETSDSLYFNSTGFANIQLSKFKKSIQEYNFNLDMVMTPEIKNQFFFIDLFLSDVEEKTADEKLRYQANISGRSLYPPKIKKIKEK